MIKRYAALLLSLTSLALAGSALADIYAYTGEDGSVSFSNVPSDGRYKLFMRTPNENPASAAPMSAKPFSNRFRADQNRYIPYVQDAAKSSQVEAALLHAVISAESGYNPNARSPKGATGLMQLMPETAKRYGITDLYDPAKNIQAGAQYLHDLMQMFNNDLHLTLAAYNAGENAVIRHGNKIPPYRETVQYVPKVLKFYNEYRNN